MPMSYDVSVSFEEDPSSDHIEILIKAPTLSPQVETLLAQFAGKSRFVDVPSDRGRIVRIRTDHIIRVYSQNRKNYVSSTDGVIRMTASISDLYGQLDHDQFLRVSRFEIINLDRTEAFDFSIVGELKIRMEGNQTVYASRRYIPVIRDYLKGGDAK